MGVRASSCFPRIRGDVPTSQSLPKPSLKFSPHTRGCSCVEAANKHRIEVFPAYAGMFLCGAPPISVRASFPRIRGDVPRPKDIIETIFGFSPHTRGCSLRRVAYGITRSVFPAYAGMFRSSSTLLPKASSFPRIRGDVPTR